MYPDILGYKLPEALEILKANNLDYKVVTYTSPKSKDKELSNENLRIARVKAVSGNCFELVACDFSPLL